jgi:hypothetical protein
MDMWMDWLVERVKRKCRSLVARLGGLLGMTRQWVVEKPKRERKRAVRRKAGPPVGQKMGQKVSGVRRGSAKGKPRRTVAVPVRVEVTAKQKTQRREASAD